MKGILMEDRGVNLSNAKNLSLSFEVIDWRDKNGHLLARIIVGQDKVVISIKCHRCKHVEEKNIQAIKN
jgi:hypothetical protein